MTATTPPILVLDLDGTLVDTAHDLIATLNDVIERRGFGPFPAAEVKNMIGHGARATLQRAHDLANQPLDDDELDRLTTEFIDRYGERIADLSQPYPGAMRALDRFRDAGWRLAVCTNKTEFLASKLLEELDIADYFAAICGQDTFAHRKPDPRHLTETIALAAGDPARAVMVGDSLTD
ncbi:MAG: HAD hydrolase-like protein, partial [Alphaproteobacteria bacterium]